MNIVKSINVVKLMNIVKSINAVKLMNVVKLMNRNFFSKTANPFRNRLKNNGF